VAVSSEYWRRGTGSREKNQWMRSKVCCWTSAGRFWRAKQSLTVTIAFCNWLVAEHDAGIDRLTQAHIDLWQSTGPTTREHIARFIRWAIKSRLVPADLEVTPHRRGTAPRMPITEQNAVLEKVAHQQTLHPRDRLAAILVIVFAQRMEDVAALTWDRVAITAEAVTITLADLPIELPPPLDEPLRALAKAATTTRQQHTPSPRGYFGATGPACISRLSIFAATCVLFWRRWKPASAR
jgi:integrase